LILILILILTGLINRFNAYWMLIGACKSDGLPDDV